MGDGKSSSSGSLRAGPRRLTMSSDTPPGTGYSAMRSTAGDGCRATCSGRSITNSVSPVRAAARCRRRSASGRASCHSSSAPQQPAFSACSAAHNASARLPARSHSSASVGTPRPASAFACGTCGGRSHSSRADGACERGCEQPHLAAARLCGEQLDEPADRPAAARQFGGQRREARVDRARTAARELRAAPQRRMKGFGRQG